MRRIVLFLTAFVLCLSLAACGAQAPAPVTDPDAVTITVPADLIGVENKKQLKEQFSGEGYLDAQLTDEGQVVLIMTREKHQALLADTERSIRESLEAMGEDATAIYVMVGTNYYTDTDTPHFIEATQLMLDACPNATVHWQKVPLCYLGWVDEDAVNRSLEETVAHFREQGEERVMLIDIYTAAGSNHWDDGIHLNAQGLQSWYNALLDHAKENGLTE